MDKNQSEIQFGRGLEIFERGFKKHGPERTAKIEENPGKPPEL